VSGLLWRRGGRIAATLCLVALAVVGACDDNDPIYGVGGGNPSGGSGEVALEILLGDLQNGRTSEAFREPLVVQATEDLGLVDGVRGTQNIQPVEALEIQWTITKGVATLSSPVSLTDSSGIASVTVTPGPLLGEIEVTAAVAADNGDLVEFSLQTTVFLVEILINRFEVPLGGDSLEVVLGDTIEWVNRDALTHAVVSTSEPAGGFATAESSRTASVIVSCRRPRAFSSTKIRSACRPLRRPGRSTSWDNRSAHSGWSPAPPE
jgi:hypothetical protein